MTDNQYEAAKKGVLLQRAPLALVLLGLVVACGGATDSASRPSSTDPARGVSDSAAIWCNENRWLVAARASQLDLPPPSVTNPPSEQGIAEAQEVMDRIDVDLRLGFITVGEARSRLATLGEELKSTASKYESGEWHPDGVKDDAWSAYMKDEATAYARSCQAAFDLRDQG